MTPESLIQEGAYFQDIMHQPRALEATLAHLEPAPGLTKLAQRLQEGAFRRVVLTGMGSSFHGLHPLNLALLEAGQNPIMLETSELIHYGQHLLEPATLIVAVSQSGRSAEMVQLLKGNARRASLIAITNTADSPLALGGDAVLLTRAGEEFSVSCKTYVSALLAQRYLTAGLCGWDLAAVLADLAQAPELTAGYLAGYKTHVPELMATLKGIKHLLVVGRGASLSAVGTGPLIIKESDRFQAEGMSSAAFRHGPMEMIHPDMFVAVFAGDPRTRALNERLASEIGALGARAALCSPESAFAPLRIPRGPEAIRPILEILPMQMITLALAALDGREAGRFERASKITATE